MPKVIRKHICLEQTDIRELQRLVEAKGGQRQGYSFSGEVTRAIREYIKHQTAQLEEASMTPVWERLLNEKFAQMEAWLRPGVWGGGTYAATAALLLLELMCGQTLDPSKARDHFELIRGRAWKLVRRDPEPIGGPARPEGGS